MRKEIRCVDTQRGIVQITTVDERWYARSAKDVVTALPTHEFVPSVTWIAEHYPKGLGFYKWLANTGWDEAQALKEAAGDKGSKVHAALVDLLDGQTVAMTAQYVNPSTGNPEPLGLEEYQAVLSFADWYQTVKPETLGREIVVWNDQEGYAGTVDYLCKIDGVLTVVDFKTSKAVWPSHRMQVSAYKHAVPAWKDAALGILQLGYERNRVGYKYTEVVDCYPLFLHAKAIWAEETVGQAPRQRDYPVSVALTPPTVVVDKQPTIAQTSTSSVTLTPSTAGGANGGTRGLGEEKQQDLDSRRRGNRGSRVSGVQNQRQSV